uniref:Uncharacterized protein n=1 Tax=Prolemur simus TaxID=1328070 RepID=A0A8C9A812_PROSS
MEEYAGEPCPWQIGDDCGGAFMMGTIDGGIFQATTGFCNSPGDRDGVSLLLKLVSNF